MLCLKARPHFFLSSLSLSSSSSLSPFKPLLHHHFKPYNTSSPQPPIIKMSTQKNIIEHIVLFKVKPNTDTSKVNAMINGLNALTTPLDHILLHLTAGPVLRNRSSEFTFTHILHSRYRTKEDLNSYAVHPSHVSVATDSIRPICDDIMAVDWVVDDLTGPVVPPSGSALRVTFLKLKEGLGENERDEVLGVIGGIREKFESIDQLTVGENFSPARAKGFSIASIAVFPGVNELNGLDSDTELANSEKGKVRDLIEGVIVVDYAVPSTQSASL